MDSPVEKLDDVSSEQDQGDVKPTKNLKKRQSSEIQPGIIYLSSIPSFMRPKRIQQIFGQYGKIGKTYLQPEEKYIQKTRKKKGGNKARSFCEGWVEFKDKKLAKRVALTLNNTRVSGRKSSRHFDDLWSIKYLPRFQWAHLVGQLEHERQVQKQRMRAEISHVKRETSGYLKNVETSQRLVRMETKKRKQGKEWSHQEIQYKQREVVDNDAAEKPQRRSGKVTGSLLGKIFANKKQPNS